MMTTLVSSKSYVEQVFVSVYQEPAISELPRFCESGDQELVELFCQGFVSRVTRNWDARALQ